MYLKIYLTIYIFYDLFNDFKILMIYLNKNYIAKILLILF